MVKVVLVVSLGTAIVCSSVIVPETGVGSKVSSEGKGGGRRIDDDDEEDDIKRGEGRLY